MTPLQTIKNKTILIQTTYQPTPHLETELEIMEELLDNGNTIYWLVCEGDFKTCFQNPDHSELECKKCNFRVLNSISVLKNKIIKNENFKILNYNSFLNQKEFEKNNNFNSLDFTDIKDLKKYFYKTYDSGLATASSLVSFARDHEPNLLNHKDFIAKGLFTGAYLYEVFQLVLNQIKPDLTLLFNGRFIENRPLLRVCQEKKLDFATHERGGKLNTFLFRYNSIPHSLQTISQEIENLWSIGSEDKYQIGASFYNKRIKRVEDAWYSFTKNQQEGRLPESFHKKTGKIITIFNSSLDEYEGLEGFGPYFYDNDNEGIKAICESLSNNVDVKLYLRVHPNLKGFDNSQNRFLKDLQSKYSSLEVIAAEDSIDTYALINASDIVVVFGSTVGAEAAFAGKNVVLLGQAAYQDLNCFVKPKNHLELIDVLTNKDYKFPEINHEDTLKYGYWNESFGMEYKYYEPKSIAEGTYRGNKIEMSKTQKIKLHYWAKFQRKKKKYFSSLFNSKK